MNSGDMMDKEQILGNVKAEICRIFPSAKVILYGSRIRGDNTEYSDWDFLILLEERISDIEKTELIDKLYDLELNIDQVFSPIIHNIVEWEGLEETPFYQHVLREGKAI